MVPVVYHPAYRDYYFGPEHPFSPVRLEMLLDLLSALGHEVAPVAPAAAPREALLAVHAADFVAQVEAAGSGEPAPDAARYGLGTPDVPAFAGMDAAARHLVGGTLHAARRAAEGAVVLQLGSGLHHAQHARAAGFCVYNDLAVAIEALRQEGLRVAYVDVDVHHGDGVQALFYDAPDVLTLSLHETGQYLYPGTGFVYELGEGAGRGYKLNVPLEPFTTDDSYLDAFERVVPHALAWFQPDVLVVQCGADAHFRDPLADLLLTTHAYETLFRRLLALARGVGRAVFTLGGGYDPDATTRVWALLYLLLQEQPLPERLPETWRARWQARLGAAPSPTLHDAPAAFDIPPERQAAIARQNRGLSQRLMETAVVHWY